MKIQQFKRKVTITVKAFATGNWTLTTSAPHFIAVGEVIPLYNRYLQKYVNVTTAAGTTGSTIVFASIAIDGDATAVWDNTFYLTTFPTGFTGLSEVENLNTDQATFQSTTTTTSGTGNHSAQYQVSNDKIAWINKTNSNPALAASPVSDAFTLNEPWVYVRINVASVAGTGGKLQATFCAERL